MAMFSLCSRVFRKSGRKNRRLDIATKGYCTINSMIGCDSFEVSQVNTWMGPSLY